MADLNNLYINNLYLKENKRQIHTYKLIPNYERIDKFVSSEMSKIPEDERVLRRDDPVSFWNFRKKDDIVFECGAYSLRKGSNDDDLYYLDRFMDVIKMGEDSLYEPDSIKLRYKTGEELFSFNVGYLPYSIQTTENLYKLGLIENRQFDSTLLHFGDLSEVAVLFSLSDIIHSTDLDELDKLIAYGIVSDDIDRKINYSNSTKVFKNLKKYYK